MKKFLVVALAIVLSFSFVNIQVDAKGREKTSERYSYEDLTTDPIYSQIKDMTLDTLVNDYNLLDKLDGPTKKLFNNDPIYKEMVNDYTYQGLLNFTFGEFIEEYELRKNPPAEEPVVEEPIVEEPVVEEPVAEEPVAEEPVVEEPVAEEPVVEEPVVEEPVVEEPVVEEPVVEEPVVEEPVVEEPVVEEPVVVPSIQELLYDPVIYEEIKIFTFQEMKSHETYGASFTDESIMALAEDATIAAMMEDHTYEAFINDFTIEQIAAEYQARVNGTYTAPVTEEPVVEEPVVEEPVVEEPAAYEHTASSYGAKGDGYTNDASALTNAFGNVPAGETLYLEPGFYNLGGQTVTLSRSINIAGPGTLTNGRLIVKDTHDVTIDGISADNFYMDISNASYVTVKNTTFKNIHADVSAFITVRSNTNNISITDNHLEDINYLTSSSTYGSGIKVSAVNTSISNIDISRNHITHIHGPAGIWIGGYNSKLTNVNIQGNLIHDTESFGIEVFQYSGELTFVNADIHENTVYNIGEIRERSIGNGSGGIYTNLLYGDIEAYNNDVRHVLEVGIEGYFSSIHNNYIEDTGMDQLHHQIDDSAGIYASGPVIRDNVIVNPGSYGGIHKYTGGTLVGKTITGNVIKNDFEYWSAGTYYSKGDLVVSNGNWYVALSSGTSGYTALSAEAGNIADGSVTWDYKKPFADAAINLNAVGGLQDLTITGNESYGLAKFASLSGFISDINITNNIFNTDALAEGTTTYYLTGYGSRTGTNVVYDN